MSSRAKTREQSFQQGLGNGFRGHRCRSRRREPVRLLATQTFTACIRVNGFRATKVRSDHTQGNNQPLMASYPQWCNGKLTRRPARSRPPTGQAQKEMNRETTASTRQAGISSSESLVNQGTLARRDIRSITSVTIMSACEPNRRRAEVTNDPPKNQAHHSGSHLRHMSSIRHAGKNHRGGRWGEWNRAD